MQELKIILGQNTYSTKITLDEKVIGAIQKINVSVGVDNIMPHVDIYFPKIPEGCKSDILDSIKENIKLLSTIPYVKIHLTELEYENLTISQFEDIKHCATDEEFNETTKMIKNQLT